ncbi:MULTISPECIES: TRM11 family methyltransferase [Roseomonadaceae]|uniref:Methyltransferase n=1 Tax=Falsiroseomonas oleicola TaxID=2801474 RepID=A0ABS6H5K3_9PROT|nr:hypothetical protein [Roseomonas oleicola]MBU8543946.1 hypothetical protein [Roseomonas oleicola]
MPAPPRPIHTSTHARIAHDFYATPAWVTEALLRHVTLRGRVWEPCCGTGAIAEVLMRRAYPVEASDIADHGYGRTGIDLLGCTEMPPGCGALVTNPPYGDGGEQRARPRAPSALLDLLRHMLALTAVRQAQLALLVRLQWIAGQRAAALIQAAPCTHVIALTRRIRWFDQGEATNGAQHHHAWLVFDHARKRRGPPAFLFAD